MGLFRERAVQNSNSLSDIGEGVTGIRISAWLLVSAVGFCVAIFVIWLFLGNVYETVSVTGVVWPVESGGAVYADTNGVISETVVEAGAEVKAGDILAILTDDVLLEELEQAKEGGSLSFADMQKEYTELTVVRSSINGIVAHIEGRDSRVKEGDVIAKVIPFDKDGNNQRITAFIPAYMLNQIQNSMEAQIVPEFASRDKDGYVHGYVSAIEKYPLMGEYIKQNYDPIFSLGMDTEQKYIRVEITMISDANSKSGLKWSNSASEETDIDLGTLCNCDIVTSKLHPYQYLIR